MYHLIIILSSFTEFIGRFHPLVVHLPIGILLVGLLLLWLSQKEKYKSFQTAVPIIILCGAISAAASCFTGYLLSISDDYDAALAGWHQWMGIAVTFTSFLLYVSARKMQTRLWLKILSTGLFVLIMITGHLGGSLTHGSDYLNKPLAKVFTNDSNISATIKPILNIQESFVYNDIVKPIFETKCYSCHGNNKQKGKLRLDDFNAIMKGGENGKIIEIGNPGSSDMMKRLLLPIDNDDHMPPKEKSQVSEQQAALLHWWIENGADFNKKVKELNQTDKIKPILIALQKAPEVKNQFSGIPAVSVEKGDDKIINQLKEKGVVVLPVTQNSNYLTASFITESVITAMDLKALRGLKKQLVELKLAYTNVSDSAMADIARLENLSRLNLQFTGISDKGLQSLGSLRNLQYLNLVGTKVTSKGLMNLKDLKQLRTVYCYQSGVESKNWTDLKRALNKVNIDSGNYMVSILPTDTIILKANTYTKQ